MASLTAHVRALHAVAVGSSATAREALSALQDWETLLGSAREHRLTPLLAHAVHQAEIPCPDSVRAALQEDARASALRAALMGRKTDEILGVLSEAGLACLPLKGSGLAARLYSEPGLRPYDDIDLLVSQECLPKARSALLAQGFEDSLELSTNRQRLAARIGRGVELLRPSDSLNIDLMSRPLNHPIASKAFDAQIHRHLDGVTHGTASLTAESEILFLVAHGTKHLWSRLLWLADLGRARDHFGESAWAGARKLADRTGLLGAFGLAEALIATPPAWQSHHQPRLELDAISASWANPKAQAAPIACHLALLQGWPARARYLARLLVTPGRTDLENTRLPIWLGRPLRLLCSAGTRRH